MGSAPPLTLAELGAALDALGRFETAPFVAVAVSGGPDSLALAVLADRWARARGGEICALSVDHRLRAESATEIRRLAAWLAARRIRHEILVWDGAKPRHGIQAAARAARYRLLSAWCREHGCLHLLTAHHRDDQAETHLFRRRARSGADGLAGMSAIRELEGCRILRPLLGTDKARLTAFLEAERQPFITDPSNRDPAFERARLRAGDGAVSPAARNRKVLAGLPALGRERVAQEHSRDRLLAGAATLHPAGFGVFDPDLLHSAPRAIAERALAALVTTVGGDSYRPRSKSIGQLYSTLAGERSGGYTLGGCRLVHWRGHILVLRELVAAESRVRLSPGESGIWDRRFQFALAGHAPGEISLGYLDRTGVGELGRAAPWPTRGGLPRLVYPILPALWDPEGLAAVPHLGYRREKTAVLPQLVFRPINGLSCAAFAVV